MSDGEKVSSNVGVKPEDKSESSLLHTAEESRANGDTGVGGVGGGKTIEIETSQQWQAPDGGYGWVIVLCALMISFIVDGLTYTFGIFLGPFERAFNAPKSTVALANSLQVGIYLLIGPVVSALTNRFGCRPVIIAGSLVAGFAYLVSSFSQSVVVLNLTYGFFGGVGFGLMYLPSIVSVSVYFEERRALATGIAVCGSGVGMFCLAPLTEVLLEAFNWRWTLVLLAGLVFNGMVFGALTRPLKIGDQNESESGYQVIGSGDKTSNQIQQAPEKHGSLHSHETAEVELKPIKVFGNSRSFEDANEISKQTKVIPPSSGTSADKDGFLKDGSEVGVPVGSLVGHMESITIEVLEEPVAKNSKTWKKGSIEDGTAANHLLLPPGHTDVANFSSSPAIHNQSRRVSSKRKTSEGVGGSQHLSKLTSSASELLARLQLSASSHGLDPSVRQARARTPLGLSVLSLAASSVGRSHEVIKLRSRVNSMVEPHTDQEDERSADCLDCLSPATRSILIEMMNIDILKNNKFWFVLMGNFFCMIGFYVPFVYIPERAIELGIDEARAAFLLSIIGISNTVGRVLIGLIVQCLRLNCVLVTTIALVVSGAVTGLMALSDDYAMLATLAAVFGLCVAAYIALCSVLLCDLLGVNNLTNAFGYVILFRGVACIIGPPLAGAIIDNTGLFDPAFYLGGGMIILGGISHLLLYVLYFCPCQGKKTSV